MRLGSIARVTCGRTDNPSVLEFKVAADSLETLERLQAAGSLTPESVAAAHGLPSDAVRDFKVDRRAHHVTFSLLGLEDAGAVERAAFREDPCAVLLDMDVLATPAEIAEQDAVGDIAALYETIRADTGSGLVNYIWRHLATIPGAAPWCWAFTQLNDSHDLTLEIARQAEELASSIAREAPGRQITAPASVHTIVAVYNKNNTANLARVTLLKEALRRGPLPVGTPTGRSLPPEPHEAIPPLPRMDEITMDDRARIDRLTISGPAGASAIVPSLWRHVTVAPGLLSHLEEPLRLALSSQAFKDAMDRLRNTASEQVAHRSLKAPGPVEFDTAAALHGLDRFSLRIADMTLIGRVVARWLSS